jgi:hypothetical protein
MVDGRPSSAVYRGVARDERGRGATGEAVRSLDALETIEFLTSGLSHRDQFGVAILP